MSARRRCRCGSSGLDQADLGLSVNALEEFFAGFGFALPSIKSVGNFIIATFRTIGDFIFAVVNKVTNKLFQLVRTTGAIFGAIPAAVNAAILGGLDSGALVLQKAFTASLIDVPDDAAKFGKLAGENFSRDFIGEVTSALGSSRFFQDAAARTKSASGGGGDDGGGGDPEADARAAAAAEKFALSLRDVQESLNPVLGLVREYAESQDILNEAFKKGSIDLDALRMNTVLLIEQTTEALEGLQDTSAIDALKEGIIGLASELQPLTESSLQYLESVDLLNEAFLEGLITGEEFAELFALVNERLVAANESALSFTNPETWKEFGLAAKKSLKETLEQIGNVEKAFGSLVTKGIDGATNAIVAFVTTGKINFKELSQAIVQELLQVIIKLLIVKALQAATGTGSTSSSAGGITTSLLGLIGGGGDPGGTTGRAHGGLVRRGQDVLVGENGPERFVPPTTGQVVSNRNIQQQQAPPQVNVNITNVSDPKEVVNGIETREGETAIMNVLSKNRGKLKNLSAG